MNLVIISPEGTDAREVDVVRAMLARGLTRYHLRKPTWDEPAFAAWADNFSAAERARFVLHGSETMARRLEFGGAHWRDDGDAPAAFPDSLKKEASLPRGEGAPQFVRSRSCHSVASVRAAVGVYDAVFLSPVFPSISKQGYGQSRGWTDREFEDFIFARDAAGLRTQVLALGGIQKSTTSRCRELGFDGVAALGAIWHATDPIAAFVELRDACSATAGRPLLAAR